MLGSSSIWEELYLGNIANIVVGYVGNVNNYYTDIDGIPFYRTQNVRSGRFSHLNLEYVTKEFHMKNKKSSIKNGDILIARVGANLGMVAKVDGLKGEANSANVIIIRPNKDLDSDYCSFFLNSAFGQNQIFGGAVGGAQGVFNTGSAQKIRIPLPPLPEQRRIAAILSQWDDSLSILTKLIEAKRQQKRGLAEQLLTGKRRLKGFGGEWRKGQISDVASEFSERGRDKSLTVLSCTKHFGLVKSLEYFGKQIFSQDTSNYKLVKRGMIAYATNHLDEGSIGLQDLEDSAVISPMYTVMQVKSNFDQKFLFMLLKTEEYRLVFASRTSASVDRRGSLRWGEFSKIPLLIPPLLVEQQAIVSILSTLDEEVNTLNALKAKVQEQKRGLMDLLLTGKVRVKVEEV